MTRESKLSILPETLYPWLKGNSDMNSTQAQRLDESFGSDLRTTLGLLREKMWLIITCILVAGIAGAAYIILSPKIYRAQAVIQVEQGGQKVFKGDDTQVQDLNGEENKKTVEQALTNPELLLELIKRNDLDKDPAFLPGLKRPASDNNTVEELAKRISARVRHGTRLIDISVEDRSPIMAQKIAGLLVKEFTYDTFRRHMEASEMAYSVILQQVDRLKAKLAKSEEALQTYKEQHQAVALGEKENVVVEKLVTLNRMVTEAKASRLKLETDCVQIKKLRNSPPAALLAIPSVASSPGIIELERTITQKEAEVASLVGHPSHFAAVQGLQELKTGLDRLILNAAVEVTSAYDSAAATENKMEEALQEQESVALQMNKILIPYNVLRHEVDSDRALYESILTRLKEIDVTKEVPQEAIRILSHPLLPERPVSPDKKRVLLLSIFGGLALGCGLSLLSRAHDGSFKTVDEAERRLRVPALGVIPICAKPKRPTDFILVERPSSVAAESFRTLRTSLLLLGKNTEHNTLLFTSAVQSEGKSFCAINCAVAFAQQGLKTLLIDADLRSPSIGRMFFGQAPIHGVTDILTHQSHLDDASRPTNIDELSVLCAGIQLDSPAELLAGEGFGRLIREALTKFDRVVVDSAPIQDVSDTLLLVGHVQATCLVVSAETSAEVVSQAVRKLANSGSTLVGFIFNRVSRHRGANFRYCYSKVACACASAGSRKRATNPSPQLPGSALQES
jgi:succinoglycan biosynthesis transport protein ExoP